MASVPGQIHTTEEVAGYIRVNRKEVNSAKILFIIVSFFVICWIPLYTINTIEAFCKGCKAPGWLLNITIILSHANSAINPLLYAYHLRDFRRALKTMTYSCRNQPTVNSQSVPI